VAKRTPHFRPDRHKPEVLDQNAVATWHNSFVMENQTSRGGNIFLMSWRVIKSSFREFRFHPKSVSPFLHLHWTFEWSTSGLAAAQLLQGLFTQK
jgi:hypothetical protein